MTDQKTPAEENSQKLPERLPILPLHETALYPKMVLPLVVMQGDSVRLVDEAMQKNRIVGLLVARADEEDNDVEEKEKKATLDPAKDLFQIGTSAMIMKMAKQDNQTQMVVQGISRFKVEAFEQEKPYLVARVTYIDETETKGKEIQALMNTLVNIFTRVVELSPGLPSEVGTMSKSIQEPGTLANMVASTINVPAVEKQAVLEIDDVKKRLRHVSRMVNRQLEILELGNKIQSQVKGDMEKTQREYYLRQQLKAIREELG